MISAGIITVLTILVATLPVFFSDTKKLTNKQLSKLEKLKQEAQKLANELEEIRKNKNENKELVNKNTVVNKENNISNIDYKKEIKKLQEKTKDEEKTQLNKTEKKVLVFSKKNLVRALITKEVLERKKV